MPANNLQRTKRKPVRSAEAVAALRAASRREPDPSVKNPDYLATHFVGNLYGALLALPRGISRRLIEVISPGSYCYFLARTRFIDDYFLTAINQGISQIVILGAGYDSRASRFANQIRNAKVFEVDLPSTQEAKRNRMRMCGVHEPANVVYTAHDFNQGDVMSALIDAGFDVDLPTFFIWEGVSYYLPEKSVSNIFEDVICRCAKGSSVVFDYSLRSFVEGDESTYGGKSMQKWLKKNNEPFLFGLHPKELPAYLKSFELLVVEDIGPKEFTSRYLTDQQGRSLGQPLGHLRMAYALLN